MDPTYQDLVHKNHNEKFDQITVLQSKIIEQEKKNCTFCRFNKLCIKYDEKFKTKKEEDLFYLLKQQVEIDRYYENFLNHVSKLKDEIIKILSNIIFQISNELKNVIKYKEEILIQAIDENNLNLHIDEVIQKLQQFQLNALELKDSLKKWLNYQLWVEEKEKTKEFFEVSDYQLRLELNKKEEKSISAFAFRNNIVAFAQEKNIYIFNCDFIQKRIDDQLHSLTQHTENICCLYYMKQSNQLVSGSMDNQIIVWNLDTNNKQILRDHNDWIFTILMNKNEDLLISGSKDRTIRFWSILDNCWTTFQLIKFRSEVKEISMNESEDKIIVAEKNIDGSNPQIKIIKKQFNLFWEIIQSINVNEYGFRLCFTIENQFIFKPNSSNYLEIYDYNEVKHTFEKLSKEEIDSSQGCFWLYPCQYLKELKICCVKHGKHLYFFQIKEKNQYHKVDVQEFENSNFYGRITDDGQKLFLNENASNELLIQNLKF